MIGKFIVQKIIIAEFETLEARENVNMDGEEYYIVCKKYRIYYSDTKNFDHNNTCQVKTRIYFYKNNVI